MKNADIPLIQHIFFAKAYGNINIVKSLLKDLSPETRYFLEALFEPSPDNYPPAKAGKRCFYQREWHASLKYFESALEEKPWHAMTALGIGRLATRTGKWQIACDWLLYAITESKRQYNDALLMQCHGAMGELLLRTKHYQESLQHMQLAYSLCPIGHPQRQRQFSYLAMPLARLGKCQVAEEYYMNAYFLAQDQNNNLGAMHALSRRAALALYGYSVDIEAIYIQIKKIYHHIKDNPESKTPLDYIHVILYWQQWENGKKPDASILKNTFSELPWEGRIINALRGDSSDAISLSFPSVPKEGGCPDPMHLKGFIFDEETPENRIETPERLSYWLKTFFI